MPPIAQGRFPKGKISTLWDAILTQLQSDSVLQSTVEQWNLWSGDIADLEPNPWTKLPAIRCGPDNGQFRWTDEGRLDGPFIIVIEYAVEGTYVGNLIDMWEAVATAMSWYAISAADSSMTWGNHLISLGVYNTTLTGPGFKPTPIAGNQGIAGRATITYSLNAQA